MVCLPFYAAPNLIHDLDQALGQQINRGKSTHTLARQLLEDERASCLALQYSIGTVLSAFHLENA